MNAKILGILLIFISFVLTEPAMPVSAFEASSTNYYVRQDLGEITGKSTSTSFWLFNNGSQSALGLSTSTSFQIIPGFIRALFQPIAPNYNLAHYYWRNDD